MTDEPLALLAEAFGQDVAIRLVPEPGTSGLPSTKPPSDEPPVALGADLVGGSATVARSSRTL